MVVWHSQREDSENILLLLVCMSIVVITMDILTKGTVLFRRPPLHFDYVYGGLGGDFIVQIVIFDTNPEY